MHQGSSSPGALAVIRFLTEPHTLVKVFDIFGKLPSLNDFVFHSFLTILHEFLLQLFEKYIEH